MAVAAGLEAATVAADASEVEGANDRAQLALLERALQQRQVPALMHAGVSFADPARFDLRGQLRHGRDGMNDGGCVFAADVALADDVQIVAYRVQSGGASARD